MKLEHLCRKLVGRVNYCIQLSSHYAKKKRFMIQIILKVFHHVDILFITIYLLMCHVYATLYPYKKCSFFL